MSRCAGAGNARTHAARAALASLAGVAAAWHAWTYYRIPRPIASDFDHVWRAAGLFWHGVDPYAATGPGLENNWPWPLFYPATTLTLLGPLTRLPLTVARPLFAGVSVALFAWALSRTGWAKLPALLSYAMVHAVVRGQWSPLIAAGFCWPALGTVFAAKPTVGAAAWLARPTRAAVVGMALVGAIATLRYPGWIPVWLATVRTGSHFTPAILAPAGPLILLVAARWRRPEARLLLTLACVPVTLVPYETLLLFVVPATFLESALLAGLSWVSTVVLVIVRPNPPADPVALLSYFLEATGTIFVVLLYLPCVLMVLARPNTGSAPQWLERALARWRVPRWLAGAPLPE